MSADDDQLWLICVPVALERFPAAAATMTQCVKCSTPVWRGDAAPDEALAVCTACAMSMIAFDPEPVIEPQTEAQRDSLRARGFSDADINRWHEVTANIFDPRRSKP